MKNRTENIYRFLNRAIALISAALLLFLFYYSLFYTHMFPKDYLEWEHVVQDSLSMHFMFGISGIVIAYFIRKIVRTEKAVKVLGIALLGIFAFLGAAYVFDGSTFLPTGDQLFLFENASGFLGGNYDGLMQGGYLNQYPYQLGLTLYMEVITCLTGEHALMTLVVMNLLALVVMGLVGLKMCEKLFGRQASVYYMILLIFMFPLYFYISFIYGECMSMMFSVIFMW